MGFRDVRALLVKTVNHGELWLREANDFAEISNFDPVAIPHDHTIENHVLDKSFERRSEFSVLVSHCHVIGG